MNSEWVVVENAKTTSWLVVRCDLFRNGEEFSYINDIVGTKEDALDSAEYSRKRHLMWDHYEALKMNGEQRG